MNRTRPGKRDHFEGLPPGAERFWGQFANTRAGRTNCQPESDSDRDPETGTDHRCLEWCPICRSAELSGLVGTPDLLEYFQAIQGDLVTILKAFMTTYAERVAETGGPTGASDDESGPGATRSGDGSGSVD